MGSDLIDWNGFEARDALRRAHEAMDAADRAGGDAPHRVDLAYRIKVLAGEIKRLEDLICSIYSYFEGGQMSKQIIGAQLLVDEARAIRERRKNG